MDPNANLREQRDIVARIINRLDRSEAMEPEQAADGERLAELVQALDEWLSSDGTPDGHGFLPKAWDNSYRADTHVHTTDPGVKGEIADREYGQLAWTAEDVQTLREDLTVDEAEAFLGRNERHLRDRLVEMGWDVLSTLLDMDNDLPAQPPAHTT